MAPVFQAILKGLVIDKVKGALTKENLNPVKTPSTGVAYTTAGALAYLSANPPGTEHDVYLQVALAIVSLVSFLIKKNVKDVK